MSGAVDSRQVGNVVILKPKGTIVVSRGAEDLDMALQYLIAKGCLHILLDLGEVTYLDSRGISVLVRTIASLEKRGGKLKVLNISGRVFTILNITNLLKVIESFDDEATALKSYDS